MYRILILITMIAALTSAPKAEAKSSSGCDFQIWGQCVPREVFTDFNLFHDPHTGEPDRGHKCPYAAPARPPKKGKGGGRSENCVAVKIGKTYFETCW